MIKYAPALIIRTVCQIISIFQPTPSQFQARLCPQIVVCPASRLIRQLHMLLIFIVWLWFFTENGKTDMYPDISVYN